MGCTGPGLKGKAPFLSGLGALICRLAARAPHFGHGGNSSPRTKSSNFVSQAVQAKSNMGIRNTSLYPYVILGETPYHTSDWFASPELSGFRIGKI
jgi:hypothetical protein